jgi:hypothetical protein
VNTPQQRDATETDKTAWRHQDRKAFAILSLALDDSLLSMVRDLTTSAELWKKLEKQFELKTVSNRLFLRKQLCTTKLREGDNLTQHISRLKDLSNELKYAGSTVSEEELVSTLLSSLPASYDMLVMSLESAGDSALDWDFVSGRLLHEERKRESLIDNDSSSALMTMGSYQRSASNQSVRQKPWNRYEGQRGRQREPENGPRFDSSKTDGAAEYFPWACNYCRKKGHRKSDCPKLKNKNGPYKASVSTMVQPSARQENPRPEVPPSASQESPETLLWTGSPTKSGGKEIWFMDSCASSYMVYDKDMIDGYREYTTPRQVSLGDDYELTPTTVPLVQVLLQFPLLSTGSKNQPV